MRYFAYTLILFSFIVSAIPADAQDARVGVSFGEKAEELPAPIDPTKDNPYRDDILCEMETEFAPGEYELTETIKRDLEHGCWPAIHQALLAGDRLEVIGRTDSLRWIGAKNFSENEVKEYELGGHRAAVVTSYLVHEHDLLGEWFDISEIMGERQRNVVTIIRKPTGMHFRAAFEAFQAEALRSIDGLRGDIDALRIALDRIREGQLTSTGRLESLISDLRKDVQRNGEMITEVAESIPGFFISPGYRYSSTEIGHGFELKVGNTSTRGSYYAWGGINFTEDTVSDVGGRHDPLYGFYLYGGAGADLGLGGGFYIGIQGGYANRDLNHPDAYPGHFDQGFFGGAKIGYRPLLGGFSMLDLRAGPDLLYLSEDKETHDVGEPMWGIGVAASLHFYKLPWK